MTNKLAMCAITWSVAAIGTAGAQTLGDPVTVDNFVRAESDLYFSAIALKEGGFGKFEHHREVSAVANQSAGLELHGAALSSARRNPEWQMDLPAVAACELTS